MFSVKRQHDEMVDNHFKIKLPRIMREEMMRPLFYNDVALDVLAGVGGLLSLTDGPCVSVEHSGAGGSSKVDPLTSVLDVGDSMSRVFTRARGFSSMIAIETSASFAGSSGGYTNGDSFSVFQAESSPYPGGSTLRTIGRCSLYTEEDVNYLSEFHVYVRKELLEVYADENGSGRVGLRCKHCKNQDKKSKGRGSYYFPNSLDGIYRKTCGWNMNHRKGCVFIPSQMKTECARLSAQDERGESKYWAESAREIGLEDADFVIEGKVVKGIRFKDEMHVAY
jgi:hypothetical protein